MALNNKHEYSEEDIQFVKDSWYDNTIVTASIADRVGVCEQTLKKLAKSLNLGKRPIVCTRGKKARAKPFRQKAYNSPSTVPFKVGCKYNREIDPLTDAIRCLKKALDKWEEKNKDYL